MKAATQKNWALITGGLQKGLGQPCAHKSHQGAGYFWPIPLKRPERKEGKGLITGECRLASVVGDGSAVPWGNLGTLTSQN